MQTELTMVNTMLGLIEESPVQSIDKTHPDVSLALDLWESNSKSIQSLGWWYNKEDYQLVKDTRTDEVFLPDGTLAIDGNSTDLVKRGRTLYDKVNHTYFLTDAVVTDLLITCIMYWSIDELPPTMYRYIVAMTKITMLNERAFNAGKLQVLEREATLALFNVQKQHLKYSDPNRQSVNNAASMLRTQFKR